MPMFFNYSTGFSCLSLHFIWVGLLFPWLSMPCTHINISIWQKARIDSLLRDLPAFSVISIHTILFRTIRMFFLNCKFKHVPTPLHPLSGTPSCPHLSLSLTCIPNVTILKRLKHQYPLPYLFGPAGTGNSVHYWRRPPGPRAAQPGLCCSALGGLPRFHFTCRSRVSPAHFSKLK